MARKNTHLNDKTLKYLAMAQTERLHQYLGLPGTFKTRYPQEVVFPNMETGRADEFYSTEEGLLIDLEEESTDVNQKTLHKFSNYAVFGDFVYSLKIYLAVICHRNPKNYPKCYERGPSLFVKPHYLHFTQEEIWKKYEKVINKVKHKIQLTDMEALDMAFIAKFISKKDTPHILKTLADNFQCAKISDRKLKTDVGVILGGMILKYIEDEDEQIKLMEKIDMRKIEKEIHKLVYDEYGDVLDAKDKEIENKNKEIKNKNNELQVKDKEILKLNNTQEEYKKGFEKLKQIKDLNPEAQKIINSLILL